MSAARLALGLAAGLAVWTALSGPALAQSAETCVILPHASAEVPLATWERVDGAVAEALRSRSVIVLAARDAQLRMMGQPMEDCSAIECAPEVNRFLGTSFAVLTEVTWNRGRASGVNVVLIGLASDHSAGGQSAVARASELEEATFAAFGIAWDRWETDRQGQLVIETTPPGAFVELDGVSVGRAPIRRLVTSGVHNLRLALEGYTSETREITIDRHEERTIAVTLTAVGAPAVVAEATPPVESVGAVDAAPTDRPHWANWVVGGGLLAAGLGLMVQPIYLFAVNGQPTPGGTGFFRPSDADWALGGTLLGLSVVSLVAGVVVLAVQPFREPVEVTVGVGTLGMRTTF